MFAVYQNGCGILGIGSTVAAAVEDARAWGAEIDAVSAGPTFTHGDIAVLPATARLVQAVQERGGSAICVAVKGGVLDIED